MPQLSPMMGFIMFIAVLSLYLVFFSGVSKKAPKVSQSKVEASNKPSITVFKLWNGSKMPKL